MNQKKSKQIRRAAKSINPPIDKWVMKEKFGKVLNSAWKQQQKHLKRAYNLVPRNRKEGWIEENIA